jgi:hypothetical protein
VLPSHSRQGLESSACGCDGIEAGVAAASKSEVATKYCIHHMESEPVPHRLTASDPSCPFDLALAFLHPIETSVILAVQLMKDSDRGRSNPKRDSPRCGSLKDTDERKPDNRPTRPETPT